jgi:succinyl-CoA synthetase alpha subunit
METIDAGIKLIVIVPEHIPVRDVMKMRSYAMENGVFALGPTTPGILVPGKGKMGIMPASMFAPGRSASFPEAGRSLMNSPAFFRRITWGRAPLSAWARIRSC